METKWRSEYRSCERCKGEYRPRRETQSYCSPACRRAAAYGRERFRNGTKGRRRRRLEASDKLPATLVAGSFRNGDFSSIETGSCRPTNWIEKTNQEVSYEIDRAYWTREKRKWPVDLMGCHRQPSERPTLTIDPKLRQAILQTECGLKDDDLTSHGLRGDDIKLKYHKDGYPILPICLDRRPLIVVAQAA